MRTPPHSTNVTEMNRATPTLPPETGTHHLRTRWAAIGAAVAVTLGGGGLLTTSASISTGERGVYVPIAPCRLFDTRPAPDNVGPRTTPLGPGDTFTATARGTNGNCTIPSDAVGLTMNVAIINPTTASFLTVYPADVPRPLAANANWTANQPPLSNAVTADISADGKIAFYNLAGNVDIATDIVGYYVDHNHDDRYYTKPQVDTALASIASGGSRVILDAVGNVGEQASVAIGADGHPIIAYRDGTNGALKVAWCATSHCTGPTTTTEIAPTYSFGTNPIVIGADGIPVIAFVDDPSLDLLVAKCANPRCSGSATIHIVDSEGITGLAASMAIGPDGNPVVSYVGGSGVLRVAKCLDPACAAPASIHIVESAVEVGAFTSMRIRSDGTPIIAFQDLTNDDLRVASCQDAACAAATRTNVATTGELGRYPSLTLGTDGIPRIASYDTIERDLLFTRCSNAACTGTATTIRLATYGDVGAYSSMQLGADGNPVIAFLDGTDSTLQLAACGDPDCGGGVSVVTVDADGLVGYYSSVAIGFDGRPVIAHYGLPNQDLLVAACGTFSCAP